MITTQVSISQQENKRLDFRLKPIILEGESIDVFGEIQKNDEICPQSFMVLVLKMQVLTESLELDVEQGNIAEKPSAPKKTRKKSSKKPFVKIP